MNGTNWSNITTFDGYLSEANRFAPFWTGVLFMIWAVLVITFLPLGYLRLRRAYNPQSYSLSPFGALKK